MLAALALHPVMAATPGFVDHGVPTPVANARGVVSTVDGNGRDVVLTWLQDHRGGYSLLMIDAETGASAQFEPPFGPGGDEPFAIHLSSRNRFYTLFNHHFVEFDVAARRFTLARKVSGRTAMSLTEDRDGRVWAATYPDNGLLSLDVARGVLASHGVLGQERWAQYPRTVAADARGWIYVGVGLAASQIYAFNPASGVKRRLLPEAERIDAAAEVVQADASEVYARNGSRRYRLLEGVRHALPPASRPVASAVLTGAQNLIDRDFPSGRRLESLDLDARTLVTRDASGQRKQVNFSYRTEGAALTYVCATGSGRICGGTRFPMTVFGFDPAAGGTGATTGSGFTRQPLTRQPNVIVSQGNQHYVAAYPDGVLFRQQESATGRTAFEQLAQGSPSINRPHALVVQPATGRVIMAGTPAYGHAGGGLLFLQRDAAGKVVSQMLTDRNIVPGHSTQAMVLLADGRLLGGTTRAAGTGGEARGADAAMLYLLDPASPDRRLLWSGTPVPGAQVITDLLLADDGMVWGIADSRWLFRFDPETRRVDAGPQDFGRSLGFSVYAQGTRAFVPMPAASVPVAARAGAAAEQVIHVLLLDGIARLNTVTGRLSRVATSPVPITAGGAAAGGRIWFASGSHLYSWQVR